MPSFSGSITTTGKSEAIRLDKALFRLHPEFPAKGQGACRCDRSGPRPDIRSAPMDPPGTGRRGSSCNGGFPGFSRTGYEAAPQAIGGYAESNRSARATPFDQRSQSEETTSSFQEMFLLAAHADGVRHREERLEIVRPSGIQRLSGDARSKALETLAKTEAAELSRSSESETSQACPGLDPD